MRKINLNPILAKKTDLSEKFAEQSGVAEKYGDLPSRSLVLASTIQRAMSVFTPIMFKEAPLMQIH